MQATPTYLINKTISYMDPWRRQPQPAGGLYSTARAIRDYPFAHPIVGAAAGIFSPIAGRLWGLSTMYATTREAISAAPGFARMLERVGRGRPEFTAPMVDTRAAMSMRQASLRAIHDSGYHLRAFLGREARLLHK